MSARNLLGPTRTFPGARGAAHGLLVQALLVLAISTLTGFAWAQTLPSPWRLADGASGELLVADWESGSIFAVNKQNLEILWRLDVKGQPLGLARFEDLILVGNTTTQNVEVYELRKNGSRLRYVLGNPSGRSSNQINFERPVDIAVDAGLGLAFVLDGGRQTISVCNISGECSFGFAPLDSQQRVLLPSAIAVDSVRKEILVSDYGDPSGSFSATIPARILIFTYSGVFLRQITGDGLVDGVGRLNDLQFARPQGLDVDNQGHVFLADCILGQVFVFDQSNVLDRDNVGLLKKLGTLGNQPGQLSFPVDVLVDSTTGDVFVANNQAKRIEVFRAAGSIP